MRRITTRSPGRNSWTKYGPAEGNAPTPSALGGRFGGTAQKYGIAVRAGKSGAGLVKRTISVFPRATIPVAVGPPPCEHVGRADDVLRVMAPGEAEPAGARG